MRIYKAILETINNIYKSYVIPPVASCQLSGSESKAK